MGTKYQGTTERKEGGEREGGTENNKEISILKKTREREGVEYE
jgi:hypothetical protein